jgi:LEA14-like dessication related protein
MKAQGIHAVSVLIIIALITGCTPKFQDIKLNGISKVEYKGLKDGVVKLNLAVGIENPNPRKITVKEVEFKSWINSRELGTIKVQDRVVIFPSSSQTYSIPVELTLRSSADALKLMISGEKMLTMITIEGFVKGGSFPVAKKIKIPRQPLSNLINKYQKEFVITNTISTRDSTVGN